MDFIVGCDADGILTDLSSHNIREGMNYFKRKPINPNGYSLEDIFDLHDIPKFKQYALAFKMYINYCKNEIPRQNASTVINELSKKGCVFNSITARKFATSGGSLGKMARKWYTEWLKKNNINFSSINYCSEERSPEEKLLSCKKIGVDVMIEDKPEVALMLAEQGIKIIMIDAPYNLDTKHENIIHAKNWIEVGETIKKLKKNKDEKKTVEFIKKDKDEIKVMTDEEKKDYFAAYKFYLKNIWFDEEQFKKNDKKFKIIFSSLKYPVKLIYKLKVFNKNRIPYQNGFILASNHCDSTDQYKLGLALGNRPFVGYAAKEIEDTFRGRLFKQTGLGIFVDRSDPINKKESEDLMSNYVAHDRIALIFPEGTRKNKNEEGRKRFQNRFKIGTVALAQRTGTAILPVATNTFGSDTVVRFGELMYVNPTDDLVKANIKLETIIANLSYENTCYYLKLKNRLEELDVETKKFNAYMDEVLQSQLDYEMKFEDENLREATK